MQAFRRILLFVICTIAYLQAQDVTPIPIPVDDIELKGIVFDGKNFWGLDSKLLKVHSFDKEGKKVLKTLPITLEKPRCLTYDGSELWIAEAEKPKLVAVNVKTGKVTRELNIEIPKERGFKSIEGLAWDGNHFWLAVFAGFSSSFYQVEPEKGTVIRSIYADCNPRGIASDGKYIWSICYNGSNLPSKIDRREILDKEHEMLRTRAFIKDCETKDPISLVYDGQSLFYADAELKQIFRIIPENPKKQ